MLPKWLLGASGAAIMGIIVVALVVFVLLHLINPPEPIATDSPSSQPTASIPTEDTAPVSISVATHTPTVSIPTADSAPQTDSKIWLTFVEGPADEAQNVDIYVSDSNGMNEYPVTSKPCYEGEPALSSDGQYVVYQSNCNGTMDIWKVLRVGGTPIRLTSSSDYEREPSFSPDGSQIAYSRVEGSDRNSSGEIWIMNTDGSGGHSLGIDGRGPTWSPDGNSLAYMSKRTGDGEWQIYTYDFTTRQEQQLTYSDADCRWPAWSPDGKYVVYNGIDLDESLHPNSIWYLPASGNSNPVKVVSGEASRPSWSTSGYIVFNYGTNEKVRIDIILMNGNQRQTIIPEGFWAWAPAWSR